MHELGALNVAHQCATLRIDRLVHVSGIGADPNSESRYVRARGKGELLVTDVFPQATTLRASVLFGPDDKFVNTLARIARRSPVLPLFGRGLTKLQPVYVDDVADAALKALKQPISQGKTYELGGPCVYSYRALIELVLGQAKRRHLVIPLPVWNALAVVASVLPTPPLTHAQVMLMKQDNVVAKSALPLADLGVNPTALESVKTGLVHARA